MWQQQVIAYCERTDLSYWSEPMNAITNSAFLIAAAVVWPIVRAVQGRGRGLAHALVIVLAVIGIGSFLWHTHATRWSGLADVLPIMVFILIYIFAATRDLLRLGPVWAGGGVLAFFPYAAAVVWLAGQGALVLGLPAPGANGAYFSVVVLVAMYGLVMLRAPHSATGRGLLIGAAILTVSLGFRIADDGVCASFALGTHFLWHVLNGFMLGWMIRLYCLHLRRV
ncbi:ceramidase domain-containing protein [Roseicitreum antarcticum]|uniref:Ceramidase n=1 Tax=Roseicitreum antarcticum TaxID=564137 RepID=A0A1H2U5D7_9RHOB|nr:ceramidase domain-containing protein [Roseicitreum antarcticum]SDW51270.1 Ceramidase [Roseicitreum antarcticum]